MDVAIEQFADNTLDPPVRGFLHRPRNPDCDGLVFTHGAGGNARGALPVAIAEAFGEAGFTVLRYDLPFRQSRAFGPPRPSDAARDRDGLRNAVQALRGIVSGRVFLGGQSYGGRQATMLCATEPGLADGLFLTSYPLHPPGNPTRLRTEHFPQLRTPTLFVQGRRDPFGSIEEVGKALALIPAKTKLIPVDDVGHDLGFKGKSKSGSLPVHLIQEFQRLIGK